MELQIMTEKKVNGFLLFGEWISKTWLKGRGCANLWIYLAVGIILCSGCGFWLLWLKTYLALSRPDLLMTFCSFAPAIAGASCMDFIFGENERKYLRGFSILFGVLVLLFTLIAFFSGNYLYALIATVVSLSLWWFANAENPRLSDIADPYSPVGGTVNSEVTGTNGEIKI